MEGQCYAFQLGAFSCFSLLDGYVSYPLQNIYNNVAKAEVENELQRHHQPLDMVTTPYTFLLVRTGQNNVLVDVGAGDFFSSTGHLVESLALAGLEPGQVDTIILSHAHPDHIGGMLDERGRPVYPNAHYYLTLDEWNFWFSEAAAARTTNIFITTARKNLEPVRERIELLEGPCEILPGITVLPAYGHTPGHAVVWVESLGRSLAYVADTVLQPLHLEHPDWLPVYDILPDKAQSSKQQVFDRAAAEHTLVLGQHFPPFPSLGKVTKQAGSWLWKPITLDITESKALSGTSD